MLRKKLILILAALILGVSGSVANAAMTPRQAVFEYARRGNVQGLQKLKSAGYNIDMVDSSGRSVLCSAVASKDVKAYNTLIKAGANANHECMNSVSEAQKKSLCSQSGAVASPVCPQRTGAVTSSSSAAGGSAISSSAVLTTVGGAAAIGGIVAAAAGGGGGGGGSKSNCPKGCSGHGLCDEASGTCTCTAGWKGDDCGTQITCPNNCSDHGTCDVSSGEGVCVCNVGWKGDDCSTENPCDYDCGDHGTCNPETRACICEYGWTGDSCSTEITCQDNCNGHGTCNKTTNPGVCECDNDWVGTYCETPRTCLNDCSGHGVCEKPSYTCTCSGGYSGEDCSQPPTCAGGCGEHGTCTWDEDAQKAGCVCEFGYVGANCDASVCTEDYCNGHGTCSPGKSQEDDKTAVPVCACDEGWSGDTCNTQNLCADAKCGEHGTCNTETGLCVCADGYNSSDSRKKDCSVPPQYVVDDTNFIEPDDPYVYGSKVINGVYTLSLGTDETGIGGGEVTYSGKDYNVDQIAEKGAEIDNAGDVSVAGQSDAIAVGMWANGVGDGTPEEPALSENGDTVRLKYASKATNSGTITLSENAENNRGLIGMKATSAAKITNMGTIDLTAMTPYLSVAMDAGRINGNLLNKGSNVYNRGTINLNVTGKALNVYGIYAPDRSVVNSMEVGDDGEGNPVYTPSTINIYLNNDDDANDSGYPFILDKNIVRGMLGQVVSNRGIINVNATQGFSEIRLIEAAAGGSAVNDTTGVINLDMTNLYYNVYALYPTASESGTEAINNGTINVTGALYNDSRTAKHVYLIGSGDGNATLKNEGAIVLGTQKIDPETGEPKPLKVSEGIVFYAPWDEDGQMLPPEEDKSIFAAPLDVSMGGILDVMNGFIGEANNNNVISMYLTSTLPESPTPPTAPEEPTAPTEPIEPTAPVLPDDPTPEQTAAYEAEMAIYMADMATYAAEMETYNADMATYNAEMVTYNSEMATYLEEMQDYVDAASKINPFKGSAIHMLGTEGGNASIKNTGVISALIEGKYVRSATNTEMRSEFVALKAEGEVPITNDGVININSIADGIDITAMESAGNKVNGADGRIYITTTGYRSDIDISGGGGAFNNAGKMVLTNNGGTGSISGAGGTNTGSIYLRALDNKTREVSTGRELNSFTAASTDISNGSQGGEGLLDIELIGTSRGHATGAILSGDGSSYTESNKINITATDLTNDDVGASLLVDGIYTHGGATPASITFAKDMTIAVAGQGTNATYVNGFIAENQHITNTGVIKINADLGESTLHQIIGMRLHDGRPPYLEGQYGHIEYTMQNKGTIEINAYGNHNSISDPSYYNGAEQDRSDSAQKLNHLSIDDYRTGVLNTYYPDVIGMATNAVAENYGTISIRIPSNSTAKAVGMLAYDGGVIRNFGTITFSGNTENFIPFYASGSREILLEEPTEDNPNPAKERVYSTFHNSGKVVINGSTESQLNSGIVQTGLGMFDTTPVSLIQTDGESFYYLEDSETPNGDIWAQVTWVYNEETGEYEVDDEATNIGDFSEVAGYTGSLGGSMVTPLLISQNMEFVSEEGGTFEANGYHLFGDVTASTSLVQQGNENVYVANGEGFGAFIGDGDYSDMTVTSATPLFDASYALNANDANGIDIVMTRKPFEEVVENKNLAQFLEKNYVAGNNEAFFDKLKAFGSIGDLSKGLNDLTGKDMLSRFNFEDMTMLRELNSDMNEKLFHNKDAQFVTSGAINPMAFKGDTGSNSRYSLYNRKSGKLSTGFAVAFTNINSDNSHSKDTRRDTVYQLIAPIGYQTNGFNLISSARFGYARGNYYRTGFEDKSYKGTLEKRVFGLTNEARYPIRVGEWMVEPAAEFNVLGYTQRGSEEKKEYSLSIKSQSTYSVEAGVGLYLTKEEQLSNDSSLKLNAGVAAYHEFADPYKVDVGMNGMAGHFTLRDENRSDNRGVIRSGFDYKAGPYTFYGSVVNYIDREWRARAKTGFKWNF